MFSHLIAIDVASGKYGKLVDKLDESNKNGPHRRRRISTTNDVLGNYFLAMGVYVP